MNSMNELLKALERLHKAEEIGFGMSDAWRQVDWFAGLVRIRVNNFAMDALIADAPAVQAAA